MTAERHARVSELFLAAVELPAAERESYLQAACDGDDALRRDVLALLARDSRAAIVDQPVAGTQVREALAAAQGSNGTLPEQIGRYRIVGLLGQGGMGTVYRAQQSSPSRFVALKVVNPALLTPALIRRFEFEAQVLAELNHPGIAQIFEAGTADVLGRTVPFFAMELIEGRPLTAYAGARQLDRRARLALLSRVCDAVHHAHQKGVIHRDLKPGNILVDEAGQPKILDFGVARTAAADARNVTLQTQPGQILGTLPYMSPEQVAGEQARIDTRSDVYALGVIAYELLSGHLPHDLSGSSLAQAVRIVGSAEPTRLSVHDPSLRGDVETIVSKATTRDSARRYPSAAELGREIERYLAGEAIEARRDSGLYVLRKALARHRKAVAVGVAFMLLLAASTAVAIVLAIGEARQRGLAERNAEQTQQVARIQARMLHDIDIEAMGRGLKQRFLAQVQAATSRPAAGEPTPQRRTPEELSAALAVLDDMVTPASAADVARGVLDEYVLDRAARAVEAQFADQPLVRAQLHQAIGATYDALGMYAQAEREVRAALELRQRALGRDHLDALASLERVAEVLHNRGAYREALPLRREVLERLQNQLGPDDERIVTARVELGAVLSNLSDFAAAEPLLREGLAAHRKLKGDRSLEVANTLNSLAEMLREKGDLAGAEAAHREALDIRRGLYPDGNMEVAASVNNLANLLTAAGRYAEAEPLQREALALFRRLLGDEHAHTLSALHNLANTLNLTGDAAAAEPLFRESIALHRKLYGNHDPSLANSLAGLGVLLHERGEHEAAEAPLREALDLLRAMYGERHPSVASLLNSLAAAAHGRGDMSGAARMFRQALEIQRALGPEHPDLGIATNNLAALLRDAGDFAAAEPVYREAIAIFRKLGDKHPYLGASLAGLGRVLFGVGRFAEAEPVFRESLAILSERLPAGDERALGTQARLGMTLTRIGKYEEAETLLVSAHQSLEGRTPPATATLTLVIEGLIELWDARDAAEPDAGHDLRAADWRARLARLRETAQDP